MAALLINEATSLESYYHYIMDYLETKYDHHSVQPVYMNDYQIAEMNYYRTQTQMLKEQTQTGDVPVYVPNI